MAQNITLLGASYEDVHAVTLPKTSGGTATFVDAENIGSKVITENGTYLSSDDGLDGYSSVVVNIPTFIEPIAYDYLAGYVSTNVWNYQDSVNNHSDIYEVQNGHRYLITLGSTVGTRFRSVVISTNPVGTTSNYTGVQITNKTNPVVYDSASFTSDRDGFFVITKDNAGTAGLKSYLMDITEKTGGA